ncbi:protein geranylgeranyltransferase type II [Cavenderia fasciculata]|uniref:Geranylgeranyl transferase type-2 subunit alpha n=1 Tax=Cavenderia fasciculata TaxID=261658 RepID=F4PXZ6_CACFS|nr:protein geranylgeranyltransferase type II [Cavenderia fasciculata]EGG19656.1 protein geranylgeranyltransferase type II [Cavenderia fasciculata]|eukprot:XP_004357950.1 protein geranylgeranyltransferase type II [Cavenderia fasciculata]
MHGVLKVKTTEEKARELKVKELLKIKEYKEVVSKFQEHKSVGVLDQIGLDISKTVLEWNPEYYTVWNYRRDIFNHFDNTLEKEKVQELLTKEMKFIEECIQRFTKSYWVWFHRKWVSVRLEKCDWARELKLCYKLLDLDLRNFHCWSYRRFVEERSGMPMEKEFGYTTEKIEQNFSNYSAWHQRSSLIPQMYPQPEQLFEKLKEEFEWVRNAVFTEPKDQSCWIYHKWLVGTIKKIPNCNYKDVLLSEVDEINGLIEIEPDCKWPIYTLLTLKMELGVQDKSELQELVDKLKTIDRERINYYLSLEKQWQ